MKLIDLTGLQEFGNNVRDWINAHFQRKVDGKGLSTYDYDKTAKDKVDAIPADPKYTDTVYDDTDLSNRVSTIEGKESGWDAKQEAINDLDTIRSGAAAGASAIPMPSSGSVGQVLKKTADGTEWANESGGGGSVTVDNELSSSSENPVQNKVIKAALDEKANTSAIPDVSGKYDTADTAETTIDDADYVPFYDTSATAKRKTLWSNIKGKLKAYFDTIYLTSQDISGKADKATTLSGYGITDAKIENGVITLGNNTITPLTSHQSLTNYVQKSQTSGLLKNDGTVDTNTYLTQHQSLSGYAKYVLCADEAAYNAISPKQSDTLYLIPEA